MYTERFQDLLKTTVDDYDPAQVLNLDGDKTTNFLVFGDRTVGCKETDGVAVTNNGGSYTIPDAPERIRAMQPGDSLVYLRADGTSLIFAVKDVTVSGNDVTLVEDTGAALTDVFSFVKIDTVSVGGTAGDFAQDGGEISGGGKLTFPLPIGGEWGNDFGGKLSGDVTLEISITVTIYASTDHTYAKLEAGCELKGTVSASIGFSDKIQLTPVPLTVPTQVPGIYITLTPYFTFSFSGSISLTGSVSVTTGFEYDSDTGGRILDDPTEPKIEPKVSGKVELGVELECAVNVIDERICKASVTGGAKISTYVNLETQKTSGDTRHDCAACLKGTPHFMVTLAADLAVFEFEEDDDDKPGIELTPLDIELKPFYYSVDHNEFGWGVCPYKSFLVTVHVTDTDGGGADGAVLYGAGRNVPVENGRAELYLAPGTYTLNVLKNDTFGTVTFTVDDRTREVSIELAPAEMIDSGACGKNVTWRLYNSGLMLIEGTGDMTNHSYSTAAPSFYNTRENHQAIRFVVIGEGVTSVGNSAFWKCKNLVSVSLPSTLRSIGKWAFMECESLEHIPLPDGLEKIGGLAFAESGLVDIDIPGGVSFYDEGQFRNCPSLKHVRLKDGVTEVADYMFIGSEALSEVVLSGSLTQIGKQAFYDTAVEHISLPEGLVRIEKEAFRGTPLTEIVIPDSVVTIEEGAFESCEEMTYAKLPAEIKKLPKDCFFYCRKLSDAALPQSLVELGDLAFCSCAIPSITIPETLTKIGSNAFAGCPLTEVFIPGTVKTVESGAFSGCKDLIAVTVEDGVEELGGGIYGHVFMACSSLVSVSLPGSLKSVGFQSFDDCVSLQSIYFDGTEEQWNNVFYGSGTSYDEERVSAAMRFTGAAADGAPEEPAASEEPLPVETAIPDGTDEPAPETADEMEATPGPEPEAADEPEAESEPEPEVDAEPEADDVLLADALAAFTGSVTSREGGQTALFTGLCPGTQYVLLVVKDEAAEDLLAPENLLFIAQAAADETGALSFAYIPRTDEASTAAVYGRSNRDLADAEVTLRDDGTVIVIYDGEVLLEGRDFSISGDGVTVTVTGRGQYGGTQTVSAGGAYAAAVILQSIVTGQAGGYTPADAAEALRK